MARDALSAVTSPMMTAQTAPAPGRTDMVKNSAGGYGFAKTDMNQLGDFLVLGTTGGTYYANEDKLTAQNAEVVLRLARSNGVDVVGLSHELSTAIPVRVPKNRGCVFALAAVSALGDPEGVQAVKAALPRVTRTTNDLSQFFGYRKQLKSKHTPKGTGIVSSRAFRSTLAGWLLAADADNVAFRACKARQRKTPAGEAFDIRDIVRIARPTRAQLERAAEEQHAAALERQNELAVKYDFSSVAAALAARPDDKRFQQVLSASEMAARTDALIGWLAGTKTDAQAAELLPAVANFLTGKAAKTPRDAVNAVTERKIPWEFLPSEVLSSKEVWDVLVHTIGITAVIRNLARMTRNGSIAPLSKTTRAVCQRLVNADNIIKGRVHPMDVYLALMVYSSGHSQPNPRASAETWSPNGDVRDALEETYEISFGTTSPSGKRSVIAVDSSASMTSWSQVTLNGARLGSAYHVACAIALTLKRIEGENTHIIEVDTATRDSRITKRTRLGEVQGWRSGGGGTDLALPMLHAAQNGLIVDGFGLLTDNETWAGHAHPFQALEMYRKQFSPHARFIDIAMTPNGHSIADPGAPGVLNIAGLDTSLPVILSEFFRTGG